MIIAFAVMLFDNKHISIILLGILYIGSYVIFKGAITTQLVIAKIITGEIACTVLWLTVRSRYPLKSNPGIKSPKSRLINIFSNGLSNSEGSTGFQLLTGILFIVSIFFLAPVVVTWLPPLQYLVALGGMTILGMGLLKLGFTDQPLQFTIGLLMFVLGFEIVYVNLEQSLLVAGLLATVTLGISIIGAYLTIIPDSEKIK